MKDRKGWRCIADLPKRAEERIGYIVVCWEGYYGGRYEQLSDEKLYVTCGVPTLLGAKRQAKKIHETYRDLWLGFRGLTKTFVAVYPAEKIWRYYSLGRISLRICDVAKVKPLYVVSECQEKCKN